MKIIVIYLRIGQNSNQIFRQKKCLPWEFLVERIEDQFIRKLPAKNIKMNINNTPKIGEKV